MAGLTDSDTILKALNEAVKAINDLILGGGDGDTTVNVTNEVVPATVNVYPQIRVNCGCGGGSDIGSGSPIDDDEATGTTPPQAGAPVDEAKCKRVNFIIDKYINFMGIWSAVHGLLAIGPAEMMAAYLAGTSTLLGAFSGLLVAGAVVTLFWAVVAMFIGGALTTAYIVAHLVSVNSNRADWVCAMYNAGDVAELRQAIVDFLGDNLAGLPQSFVEYHVDHLFPNNVLNGVFNGWTGDVAAELDAYTSPADCADCGGGLTHWIIKKYEQYAYGSFGTLYDGEAVEGGIVSNNFQVISWHSIWDNMRFLGLTGNEGEGVSIRLKLELFGFTPRDDYNGNCVTIYWADKSQQTYSAAQISTFYALMSDMEISADPALGFHLVSSTDFTANITVL